MKDNWAEIINGKLAVQITEGAKKAVYLPPKPTVRK